MHRHGLSPSCPTTPWTHSESLRWSTEALNGIGLLCVSCRCQQTLEMPSPVLSLAGKRDVLWVIVGSGVDADPRFSGRWGMIVGRVFWCPAASWRNVLCAFCLIRADEWSCCWAPHIALISDWAYFSWLLPVTPTQR